MNLPITQLDHQTKSNLDFEKCEFQLSFQESWENAPNANHTSATICNPKRSSLFPTIICISLSLSDN